MILFPKTAGQLPTTKAAGLGGTQIVKTSDNSEKYLQGIYPWRYVCAQALIVSAKCSHVFRTGQITQSCSFPRIQLAQTVSTASKNLLYSCCNIKTLPLSSCYPILCGRRKQYSYDLIPYAQEEFYTREMRSRGGPVPLPSPPGIAWRSAEAGGAPHSKLARPPFMKS